MIKPGKKAYGQCVSIIIASSVFFSSKLLVKKAPNAWLFLVIGFTYISLFVISNIIIAIKGDKIEKKVPIYRYVLAGFLDFMGSFLIGKAYQEIMSPYLTTFLAQFLYPMCIVFELSFFKRKIASFSMFISFLTIVCACFLVNYKGATKPFCFTLNGIICVIVSNICYMLSGYNQSHIIPKVGIYHYLRGYSAFCFIIGLIISATFDLPKGYSFNEGISFITTNWVLLAAYTFFYSSFYFVASAYIGKFGVVAFNASLVSFSLYYGLLEMIYKREFNYLLTGAFGVCLVASLILVQSSS